MSKKFIIEISKLDPDGVPTLDKWANRAFVGTCMAPLVTGEQSYDGWAMAAHKTAAEFAESAAEIGEEWRDGLEAKLGDELVERGLENGFSGVIVFELVPYGRNGKIESTRPRRFYIFRIGSDRALYSTDSIADAFSEARNLADGIAVDGNKLRSLPVPAPNVRSSRYEV